MSDRAPWSATDLAASHTQMNHTQMNHRPANSRRPRPGFVVMLVSTFAMLVGQTGWTDEPTVTSETATKQIQAGAEATVKQATAALVEQPDSISLLSQRGDAYFFLGQFDAAVRDYDRMAELDPKLDSSHWRRGIAWFYAGEFRQAAGQFERYHTFDQIDRENGIWRYLSQVKAYGRDKARQELLKYEKDDREPFPAVYQLFAGKITPQEILDGIAAAKISEEEREKRLFYAQLYIGLNEAVEDRPESAARHLELAVANRWAPRSGYGPRYMWHVGRLHARQLATAKPPAKP